MGFWVMSAVIGALVALLLLNGFYLKMELNKTELGDAEEDSNERN